MLSLPRVFPCLLLALALAGCEDSPPLVDDVREDAAVVDAGVDAADGAAD